MEFDEPLADSNNCVPSEVNSNDELISEENTNDETLPLLTNFNNSVSSDELTGQDTNGETIPENNVNECAPSEVYSNNELTGEDISDELSPLTDFNNYAQSEANSNESVEEDPIIHDMYNFDPNSQENDINDINNFLEEKEEDEEEENKLKIPKRIFQTHKSILHIKRNPKLIIAINSWRRFVPEYGYHFYTDEMCDEFMKTIMVEEFGDEIYEAYNRLPMAVMKADLWRYCVIYKYGGIYADTDAICKCNPNMFTLYDTQMVCAPETDSTHLCQWTFAAPAGSPILKSIIELSVIRILSIPEIKGEHVIHFLTGPGVFTNGIENYLSENNKPIFSNKKKYFLYKNPTMICFREDRFHKEMIHHLFAGRDVDGWSKERFQKLI